MVQDLGTASNYQDRANAFAKELADLSNKHQIKILPQLEVTVDGIKPVVGLADTAKEELPDVQVG